MDKRRRNDSKKERKALEKEKRRRMEFMPDLATKIMSGSERPPLKVINRRPTERPTKSDFPPQKVDHCVWDDLLPETKRLINEIIEGEE